MRPSPHRKSDYYRPPSIALAGGFTAEWSVVNGKMLVILKDSDDQQVFSIRFPDAYHDPAAAASQTLVAYQKTHQRKY